MMCVCFDVSFQRQAAKLSTVGEQGVLYGGQNPACQRHRNVEQSELARSLFCFCRPPIEDIFYIDSTATERKTPLSFRGASRNTYTHIRPFEASRQTSVVNFTVARKFKLNSVGGREKNSRGMPRILRPFQ
eukprot:scaffold3223_cov69-Cylindrotheca_fusiformis.AAC.2